MATKTFSGNSNYRLEAVASRSGKTITVTVTVEKLSGSGFWTLSGEPYTVVIDGTTYSGSWTYDFRGVSVEPVTTRSKTVAVGARSWSVSVSMGSGIGSASLSGPVTVPPDAPAAPTIGEPVRVSDVKQTVHWTRNATTSAFYDSQQVQRRVFSGAGGAWGAWVGVATIGTNYTTSGALSKDDVTVANRAYEYRVKASNASGEAFSAASLIVFTTPGAPSDLVAVKTPSGGIALTLTRTVAFTGHTHEVEYSTDGTTWVALASLGSMVTGYTWNTPPAGETLVFRARAVVDAVGRVGDGLVSSWRVSNSVALAAPPNPPSGLTPNGSAFEADGAQAFTWQHNPVDASPQLAYDFRYRPSGGVWVTLGETASDVSSRTVPAGTFTNGTVYEWQVRSWGVHDDPSDWSNTATFTCSTAPVATILSPEAVLPSSVVTLEWTYFDAETTTQSAWQAELLDGSGVVEARSGPAGDTSVTFAARLVDAAEYTVRVRVRDGHGLWSSWDQVTFTTDFPAPVKPRATAVWDAESGSVNLAIENAAWGVASVTTDTDDVFAFDYAAPSGDSDLFEDVDGVPAVVDGADDFALVLDVDGTPAVVLMVDAPDPDAVPAVSNDIIRSVDGGDTWETIATGISTDAFYSDATAPVGVEVLYKVVAWSDLPSSIESDTVVIVTPDDCGYWSASGVVVRMYGEVGSGPRLDFTRGLASKTVHYFAGRTLPVEVAGVARARTGSVSFTTLEPGEIDTVRQLAYLPAPHLFRSPHRDSVWASIGDVTEKQLVDDAFRVSVSVTEVEQ